MSTRPVRNARLNKVQIGFPTEDTLQEIESILLELNKESYPVHRFASVDDVIVSILFETKREAKRQRALHPSTAFPQSLSALSTTTFIDHATKLDMRHDAVLTSFLDDNHVMDKMRAKARTVADSLIINFSKHFTKSDKSCLMHLLIRYRLLYHDSSPIKLEKVSYNNVVAAGIKACHDIEAGAEILQLSSSMSSDLVCQTGGISVIQGLSSQLGPEGPRAILGPFRFVNHDCKPNCHHYKIAPVKGTNAYTVVALCKVYAGESVTVSYSNKGYKGYSNEACLCRSCNPSNPPVMAKRMRPTGAESLEEPNRRKKTRRGKRKHKKQPKADGLEDVSEEMMRQAN